jgi:hypothetical protein
MIFIQGRENPMTLAFDRRETAEAAARSLGNGPGLITDDHKRSLLVRPERIAGILITDSKEENKIVKPVFSSHVHSVGYDAAKQELTVTWHKDGRAGRTSIYSGVPPHIGNAVVSAPSVGDVLHAHVKGIYDHRYRE